jgi:hypothetical protein
MPLFRVSSYIKRGKKAKLFCNRFHNKTDRCAYESAYRENAKGAKHFGRNIKLLVDTRARTMLYLLWAKKGPLEKTIFYQQTLGGILLCINFYLLISRL